MNKKLFYSVLLKKYRQQGNSPRDCVMLTGSIFDFLSIAEIAEAIFEGEKKNKHKYSFKNKLKKLLTSL